MNMMIAMTISAGATTAAVSVTVFGYFEPTMGAPAATRTRKKVPTVSETRRRHSCFGSWKSEIRRSTSSSQAWASRLSIESATARYFLNFLPEVPG
jgi:hypothetical protein